MLYVETVSSLMNDVPSNVSDLFTKVDEIHTHKSRISTYIFESEPKSKVFFQILELNSGIPTGTNFDNSQRVALLKSIYMVSTLNNGG